jgi:hypothetical protein
MSTIVRRNIIFVWLVAITVLLGVLVGRQAAAERKTTALTEIDVERINVREPDGTLRMTISSSAAAPGLIFKGKEHPFPSRQAAGILFFNDEGTESGGLLFGGARKGYGVSSGGHLSFDQFEQDEVISLDNTEEHGRRRSSLTFYDRPESPLPPDLIDKLGTPEGSAAFEAHAKAVGLGYPRLFIGKTEERASAVILRDENGLARLKLTVTPSGSAAIEFLDESGKVVRRIGNK